MARIVSSSITIGAGTTDTTTDPAFSPFDSNSANDRPAFIYTSTIATTTFVNHGTVTATQAQGTSGYLDGFVISPSAAVSAQNLFQNASDGRFGVVSNWLPSGGDLTLGRTIGFFAPQQMIAFRNDGLFEVRAASGEAYGVNVSGSGLTAAASITNSGTITVASAYAAVGVYGATSVAFDNGGTITATGTTLAEGVHWDTQIATSFNNRGTITATTSVSSTFASVGVSFNRDLAPVSATTYSLTNSGTIQAEVAVFADFGTTALAAVRIINSGSLLGDVMLSFGNDIVDNSNRIVGDVRLGAGNDSYNGASGTIQGNVFGGAGNDTLVGGAGAETLFGDDGDDVLTGGGGADTLAGGAGSNSFRDSAAGHGGDTITDLATKDHLIFTDATLANFTFSLSGTTLTYSGGSLTLANAPIGYFVASAAAGGGVDLRLVARTVDQDFNGDGRSDILWRNTNGALGDWFGNPNGGFTINGPPLTTVANNWHISGTGDFNGDGRADILWRSDSGIVSNWLGTAAGGFTPNDTNAAATVGTSWTIAGTGDFNGDGRDDILWRNDDGTISDWLGTANGGFAGNDGNALIRVATRWHVAGTGDFNGDGKADILWRSDSGEVSNWLGNSAGGFSPNDANAFATIPLNWQIQGTGDFNGDGRDDILWRKDDGTVGNWLGTASGGFAINGSLLSPVATSWHIVGTGDYNGDGRADILWRSDGGGVSDWLGTASGDFTINDSNALTNVATSWQVQPDMFV